MKKIIPLVIIFIVVFTSCKTHKNCPAYSKIENTNKSIIK